tara:strand:- start:92 stop:265 length:174 start_codon:yes stop_codon:yes gene_type:complete
MKAFPCILILRKAVRPVSKDKYDLYLAFVKPDVRELASKSTYAVRLTEGGLGPNLNE